MNYLLLKLLHVAAVIVFLGNIISGHFWMNLALKSKDVSIIRHSVKGIMLSDRVFTIPAVIIIVAAGIFAAFYGNFPVLRTGWILWSIVLFSFSGMIFSRKLSVVQRKMLELTHDQNANRENELASMGKLYKEWNTWALIAIIMTIGALVMMVLKIPA